MFYYISLLHFFSVGILCTKWRIYYYYCVENKLLFCNEKLLLCYYVCLLKVVTYLRNVFLSFYLRFCFCTLFTGWSKWSDWSSCSVSCSAGIQQRIRHCQLSGGKCHGFNLEQRHCNLFGYALTIDYLLKSTNYNTNTS